MKIIKTISLFLLANLLTLSGVLHAADPYGSCGTKPGFFDRLINDAEKIRLKCIDDIYEANKEKVRKEIEDLHETSNNIGIELKKVAIKVDFNIVQCSPRSGEASRDPKLVQRCQELVSAKNAVISRIDELMGWNDRPRSRDNNKANANTASISPPCPSKEKLKEMQVARMFNRKLFQTWERCVTLDPTNYDQ